MSAEPPPPSVSVHRSAGVATIRMERPAAMNALDVATKEELLAAVREVAADPQVRCVVLTGSGAAFSVGQDLKEHVTLLHEHPERVWRTVREHYNPIVRAIAEMDKPVIAALNGVAAGAGASLAFAADLRYLADTAGFTLAFAGIGLSCDSGASWFLPRLVGMAKAKEVMMLGGRIGAAEALRLGLATAVVPASDLDEHVGTVAHALAAGPTLALGAIRRAVAFSASADLADSLEHEADLMDRTGSSQDHAGAVASFLAKTTPEFTGR
ncbi:MAG: enoyl-CoA hydratase-related protein [Ornithinimicrobium sp.]